MAALTLALGSASLAAEHVTLRNGFQMDCDHHRQVESRIRLYLSPGEDNYIEFPAQQIAAFEDTPDPPSVREAAEVPQSSKAVQPNVASDTTLSPADLHEMLAKAGSEHNLDVDLLASLVNAESGGNTRAVSRTGARGLMQLMPATAAGLGVEDSFKADENVRGGSAYLDALLARYHDNLALALAAYNAGPLAVDNYRGIPPYRETRAYVARVIHEFNRRVHARGAKVRRESASSFDEKTAQLNPSPLPR